MTRPLQEFSFRDSHYERPNQDWVCGHAASGYPCRIGPDSKGRCRATFECRPLRQADRWICTRSDFAGGRCASGPLPDGTCCNAITPCEPARSWRAKRRLVTRLAAFLTFGLLLVLLSESWTPHLLDPGPVTFQHSQLGSCGGCHVAFEAPVSDWPAMAFATGTEAADSRKCGACHEFGDHPLSPHSLAPAVLSAVTGTAQPTAPGSSPLAATVSRTVFGPPPGMSEALACGTCHREHQGQDNHLAEVANARCIGCHTAVFDSLSGGHPDFKNYPFDRTTRVIFDHGTHFDTHFGADGFKQFAPKECASCHTPDPMGETMALRGYEVLCQSCHGAQIAGTSRATSKGIEIFAVPGLDVHAMLQNDLDIGEWPEDAEATVTPFMDLLLSADEGYAEVRDGLADVDLLDLTDADQETLELAKRFAWHVKGLFFDIAVDGAPGLRTRLEKVLDIKLDAAAVAGLTGALTQSTVDQARQQWFPSLMTEVPLARSGQFVANEVEEEEAVAAEEAREVACPQAGGNAAGATLQDGALLDCPDEEASSDGLLAEDGEGEEEKSDDGLLAEDEESDDGLLEEDEKAEDSLLAEDEKSDDGLLAEDEKPDEGLLTDEDKPDDGLLAEDEKSDDGLLTDEEKSDDGLLADVEKDDGSLLAEDAETTETDTQPPVATSEDRAVTHVPLAEPKQGEDWVEFGGWFQDYFSLRYRPVGHADAFITAWLRVSGEKAGATGDPRSKAVFELLATPGGPGVCTKCHSVETGSGDAVLVNWLGARADPQDHAFTRFSHAAHFNLLNDQGCLKCHDRDPDAKIAAGYKDRDPATHTSNFVTVERATCAECHTEDIAGDACVSCHNYHIGTFPPAMTHTHVSAAAPVAN